MFQYREAANFPWVSQAEWLYTQMVRWDGLTYSPTMPRKRRGCSVPTYTAVH